MRDRRPLVFPIIFIFMIWMFIQYHRINLQEIGDCQDPLNDHCLMGRGIDNIAFITSYYQPQSNYTQENIYRQAELDVCLASATGHPLIQTVHILGTEKDLAALPSFAKAYFDYHTSPRSLPKVVPVKIEGRPMMADFLRYACDNLKDHRVMFANADIYFDMTLEYFIRISDSNFDRRFFAISRWQLMFNEYLSPNMFIGHGSYDTFLFRPRVLCGGDQEGEDLDLKERFKELLENLNYPLGVLGAENRLLYEIHRLYPNLWIRNPARTVKTLHMHNSTHRGEGWIHLVNENGKSYHVRDDDAF
ncbi:hypothetical protein BGX27_008058 [Mortierella sp. AM989]|nr:hypothetical protein BGX27_008058 [Mortierella sp. AM989]